MLMATDDRTPSLKICASAMHVGHLQVADMSFHCLAIVSAGGDKLAAEGDKFSVDEIPSQSGKVAVITGGSEGIGYGVSYHLLKNDIKKLYILSVSQEVVDGAKKAIAEELGQDKADRTHWIRCDLADWSAVADAAAQIAHSTDRLDIFVGNSARGM